MKIVDYQTTSHTIRVVPRFYPSGVLTIRLFNESTNETFVENCTYSFANGYLDISFDFDFANKDRFSFKVIENDSVVYRGKILSTKEDTQSYKQSTNLYEY